ncbi:MULTISPECIES: hypothetical protein [unclassified Streptomyces]|uniref:TPR repeat region-containing protein n=1 Tax=unclassified Streptomyces TaxID=2593676 RepID=UPI000CD57C5D|nr:MULTISPECIES: hypothetical protein [unclassified Streptomyces]
MTQSVHFDHEDVKAAASQDPWELRDDFVDEVDVEDIAEAALSYAMAAEEAGSAEELAELATEEHQGAAQFNSDDLADAEGRLAETKGNLATPELESTVDILGKTVTLAEDTVQEVDDEIYAHGSLNTKVADHCQAAVDELNLWFTALQNGVDEYNDMAVPEPVVLLKPDGSSAANPERQLAHEQPTGVFSVPDDIIATIRQHHLDAAVADAEAAAAAIDGHIEGYRSTLTTYGAELTDNGYDMADSPLGIWHTPEMAEHHAQTIANAAERLEADPSDSEALGELESATAYLGNVSQGLFDENGNPVGQLSEEQAAYLKLVYDNIDPEHLATVGNLAASESNERFAAIGENLANGINALTSPSVNAFVPTAGDLPDSIAYFVDGGGIGPSEVGPDGIPRDPSGVELLKTAEMYNGFGALMEGATVPPGESFAGKMLEAGLAAQDWWTGSSISEHAEDEFQFTGGSSLLAAGAENSGAASDFLTRGDHAQRVMGHLWDDGGDAVARLIESGTFPSEGEEITPRQAAAARQVVLATGDLDADQVQQPVQQAAADVGIMYMHSIVGADMNDSGAGDGPFDIFGEKVPGFTFTESERRDFFRFLAGSEEEVESSFAGGIQTFHYVNAHAAFSADDPEAIARMGAYSGVLDAEFQRAQWMHQFDETKDAYATGQHIDKTWRTGAGMTLAAAGILVPGAAPVSTALSWTGVGNTLIQAVVPPPVDTADSDFNASQYNAVIEDGRSTRYIIAQAAADTNYRGAADAFDMPSLHDASSDEIAEAMVGGNFVPDLAAIEAERYDISPYMDPRVRLLVRPTEKAMEEAGVEAPDVDDEVD